MDSGDMLVVGANGGIGSAVATAAGERDPDVRIFCISRSEPDISTQSMKWIRSDHSEKSIASICEKLKSSERPLSRIVISTGILHTETISPEKRIESLDVDNLLTVMRINAGLPILWLKHLLPVVEGLSDCRIAVLSARVGSISDNGLGGWYSYRSSKAALNMLMKCAAIEYKRRAKGVKLLSFHPGTTDTALSKPFQGNVQESKLFEPAFVANQLLDIMDGLELDGELSFLDWDGQPVEW